MITLILFFALQVTAAEEMSCIGSVVDFTMPADLYIAGIENEGTAILAAQGEIVYLNGPRTGFLEVGDINAVVRPVGKVRDPSTGKDVGIYYKDLGTIRIESIKGSVAVAQILQSCYAMTKGDLVVPRTEKPAVEFQGELSNAMTPLPPDGLNGTILLGKGDSKELADRQICFINLGWRDGVKTGDRFIAFRDFPSFNRNELGEAGITDAGSHSLVKKQNNRSRLGSMLSTRTLPEMILGDIVVVDVGEKVSAGKIINSLSIINPGDFVVKK